MATAQESLKEKILSMVNMPFLFLKKWMAPALKNTDNINYKTVFKYHFLNCFLALFVLFSLWLAYAFLVPVKSSSGHLSAEVVDITNGNIIHGDQVHGRDSAPFIKADKESTSGDGMFESNRRKTLADVSGKNVIAVLIQDFGLSGNLSAQVLANMPADATLILSPYADNISDWSTQIRARDQEFWLYVPMESESGQQEDSGALTLLSQSNIESTTQKIKILKEKTQGYAGIAMQNDGVFDANPTLLRHSLSELTGNKTAYLELNPDAPETALNFARMNDVPVFHKDMDLTQDNLQQAESLAEKKGYAIVSIALSPASLEFLQMWIASMPSKNLAVVPLSALHTLVGDSEDEVLSPPDKTSSNVIHPDESNIVVETLDNTKPPTTSGASDAPDH